MRLTLNLASRSYLNRRVLYAVYLVLAAALAALFAMSLLATLRSQQRVEQIRSHLAELDQDYVNGQDLALSFNPADYQLLLKDIEFANDIISKDNFQWTELLGHLEIVVPDGVAIRGLSPDFKGGSLQINGVCRGLRELQTFLDNLLTDAAFSETYLLQQGKVAIRAAGGRQYDATGFSLVVKGAF